MSLQEKVEYLKEEMSTEEKFFEGFFKLEKIWKKYKIVLISVVSLLFMGFVGTNINDYMQEQNTIKANNAFNALLENRKDAEAINILKDLNPKLLKIANYLQDKKDGKNEAVNIEFLDEIVKFNMALNENNLDVINKSILNSKFVLKEYALFQKALILTIDKKYLDAKETLALIPDTSTVAELSNKLKHHLLTK